MAHLSDTLSSPVDAPPVHAPSKGVNWDPVVRVTHWVVAMAVLLDGLIVEDEGQLHIWIGYAALAMLALRMLWGIVGTEEARFSAFPPSPSKAKAYFLGMLKGKHPAQRSHNPIGAFMVYALWGTLAVVIGTGIGMENFNIYQMEEVHEVAANLVLALAFAHVCGVLLESRLSGVNLIRNMIVGTKSRGPE
jgi:cytochrome b